MKLKRQNRLIEPGSVWFLIFQFALLVTINIHTGGCGTIAGNPEEDEPDKVQAGKIPEVDGINLSNIGVARTNLLAEDKEPCEGTSDLGVFGLALGSACHTTNLPRNMLYGENADYNGDGELSCEDYESGRDDQGIIFALLCEQGILQNPGLRSLRFSEDEKTIAISFADFDSTDDYASLGTWTGAGEDIGRYPANIRIWDGKEDAETLNEIVAIALSDAKNGKIFLDFSSLDYPALGETDFSSVEDASKCASAPSKENCFWQETKLKSSADADADSLPPGFHLEVYANAKEDPDFILIEGKFRYTEELSKYIYEKSEDELPATWKDIREIYFRTVQKGNQIWGSFDLKDENNETIVADYPATNPTVDLAKVLRNSTDDIDYAGICQDLGSDDWVECTDIDYQDYDDIWTTDAEFDTVPDSFELPDIFDGVPEEDGLVR